MVGPPKVNPPIGVTVPVTPVINLVTGAVTYTFPAVPAGSEQNVSATVPGSPVGVSWTVNVNGTPVGGMVGNQPFGAFYVGPNAIVTITCPSSVQFTGPDNYGLGLAPGSAVLIGSQGARGQLGPVSPTQGGGYPSGIILLAEDITLAGSSVTPLFTTSTNARGIIVVAVAYPSIAPSTGSFPSIPLNTGALVQQVNPTAATAQGTWFIPLPGVFETQISFPTATQWFIFEVDFDFDYPAVAATIPVVPTPLGNPSPGKDWTLTLTGPARLTGVTANLVCSAAGANRYANISINYGAGDSAAFFPLNTAAITANQTAVVSANKGMTYADVAPSATLVMLSTPLPDILMPAGSIIASVTRNIDTGDQWEFVVLTFSPV
jgi:hypothetical protein